MSDAADKIKKFKKAKGQEFLQDKKRKSGASHDGGAHKKPRMALPASNPLCNILDNKKFIKDGGKPDWNKIKQETKVKKQHKKKKKLGGEEKYDAFKKATKLWEELRDEKTGVAQKKKLCSQVAQLFYGNVTAWIRNAGGSRMLQHLVEHGDAEIRRRLFAEIDSKETVLAFTKDTHDQKVVMKFIRHGTKEQRAKILGYFSGKIVSLTKHNIATHVIELAYGEFSTAPQRAAMLQEFFGAMFALFKEEDVRSLSDVLQKHPDQKKAVMAALQRGLQAMLHKGVLNNTLILSLMREYMLFSDEAERQTVVESIQDGLLAVVHTRDGARIAQLCLWNGSAKQRKAILKSFKEHLMEVATTEHANTVLMAALDCVDDTKFLAKAVIDPLLANTTKLVETDAGVKTFMYIVLGRNPTFFSPALISSLKQGDGNSYSKKDAATRRREVTEAMAPTLSEQIVGNIEHQCRNPKWTLFLGDALKALPKAEQKTMVMTAIAKHAGVELEGADVITLVDLPYSQKMLCYCIKQDAQNKRDGMPLFSLLLLKHAKANLTKWLSCNRGCFLALVMLETGVGRIVVPVRRMVREHIKMIKANAGKFKGAKLLVDKLASFEGVVETDVEESEDEESEEEDDQQQGEVQKDRKSEQDDAENGESEKDDSEDGESEEDDEDGESEEDDEDGEGEEDDAEDEESEEDYPEDRSKEGDAEDEESEEDDD